MFKLIKAYKLNEKISSLISYLLVTGMLFCVGFAAREMLERILPAHNMSYLPFFCALVSLASIYNQRRMHHSYDLDINPLVYRIVEWVVILILLKITIYASDGFGQLLVDLPRWQSDFIGSFFTAEYLLDIVVVVVVWGLSLMFVEDLIDLEGDVNILQATNLDMVVSNRSLIQSRMVNRIMTVGIGLVIMAILSRLDYSTMFSGLKLAKQGFLYILAYFLLGLVLLSLTQLATRRAVWAWEHIPVSDGIARNWVIYSLGFIFILSCLAFLLPTSYTMGFLPTIRYLLSLLFGLLYTLVMFIIFPIFIFFAWLINLFGFSSVSTTPMAFPDQILPPMPEDLASTPSPFLAILKSVLFWGILLVVIIYAFRVYFRQNRELIQTLRRIPGLSWLVKAWRWLVSRARGGINFLPNIVKTGIERLRTSLNREPSKPLGKYINYRTLTARQKALFYYLALLRRSGEAGLPRKLWQTPDEFAQDLSPNLQGSEADIESMTNIFVEARYTKHSIDENQVKNMQNAWNRIRMILKELRKG